jgi:hypothetical protein
VLILLCSANSVFAQPADSSRTVSKFIPTGIRLAVDMVSIAKSRYVETFDGFETSVDVDIYRYYPTVEFGNGSRNYVSEFGSTYTNEGRFWRAGIDINFMKKDTEKNMFFLGFRYGRSKYSENATILAADTLWGSYNKSLINNDMTASWLELTTGLRVKVWKFFWMGYTGRFKFAKQLNENQALLTTDVPGYGATDRPTTWGFSYYLMVKLPFRRQR